MNELGKEYASALFMLALEEDRQKEYYDGLEIISTALKAESEYTEFLSCPAVPLAERLSSLESAFGDSVPEAVLSFMQLLCEKGRTVCFFDAVKEYKSLLDSSMRISEVKVTSAVALTEAEKTRLKDKLESTYNRKVNIEYFIDESLLGGLVVDMDGRIMDSSLRRRLRDVKEVITT